MADRDEAGRFVKGNQLHTIAAERAKERGKTFGRPKRITPEELYTEAIEYFEWCEDNPLPEQKIFHAQGIVTKDTIFHKRPYTYNGLYLYTGLNSSTYHEYKSYSDYSDVIKFIDDSIRENKYIGAAAGYFNANIIARDLGLRDSQDVDQKVSGNLQHDHEHKHEHEFSNAVLDALRKKHGE